MADDVDQDTVQNIVSQRRNLLASQPPEPTQTTDASAGIPRQKQQLSPQSTGLNLEPTPKLRQYNAPLPQTDQFSSPFEVFKDPMVVLAGLSSLLSRKPLINAMNYAAGAMKGFHQGQKDVFEQNKEKFDEAIKATLEQNRVEMNRYQAQWDWKRDTDWQKSAHKLYAEAAANKDELMMAAIQSGNPEAAFRVLEGREAARNKIYGIIDTMNARAEVERGLKPTLTDDAILQFAQRENAGDHSWRTGLGRGIQGKADIDAVMNKAAQLALGSGQTGEDIAQKGAAYTGEKAYQRSAATYASRVESAVNEADGLIPQALEASKNLPRGKWVQFNRLYQSYLQGSSDPSYNDFMAANIALLNTYIRAMNPQGVPRITERLEAHAIGLLDTAVSQEAYEIQVRRLFKEMQISKASTAKTRAGVSKPEEFPETAGPVKVQTPAEAQKLAPGTHYVTPDGREFTR